MLKRQASAPNKNARKKKKGNATYTMASLDPTDDDGRVVEDIRVWDISTSETTGRVRASRRTHKHYSQASSSLPGGSSTNKKLGEGDEEVASVEDTGNHADSETSGCPKRKRAKRVRILKENDSVSSPSIPCSQNSLMFPDKDGTVASELSGHSG